MSDRFGERFGKASSAWSKRAPRAGAIALCAIAVAACGFQLRGVDIATAYATVRVEADASVDFAAELRTALRAAGATVTTGDAALVIRLARQRAERRPSAVDADARAAEHTLGLAVEVAYLGADGAPLTPARTIDAQRTAVQRRGNFLGSGTEESLLAAEMRAELTARILRAAAELARPPPAAPESG